MKNKFLMILTLLFVSTSVMSQDQDRTRQKDQDKTQLKKQDRIYQEDHLKMEAGKLYQVREGIKTQVQSQIRLQNGTVINPDGSYQFRDQDRMQLKNGQCFDMAGNKYRNENKFNRHEMMTLRQMEQERIQMMNRNTNQMAKQDRAQQKAQRRGGNR